MKKKSLIMLCLLILLSCRLWAEENYIFNVMVELDITSPKTKDDYDGLWHNKDFVISLTPTDSQISVKDIYYKINDGEVQSVSVTGPPLISTEGGNNKLEYWSVDEFGNEELPHNVLTGIKLDETPPLVDILSPSDGSAFNESLITITGTTEDRLSGIESIKIDVAGETYNAVVKSDGTFSVTNADIIGGPNNIKAWVQDVAGNEAEDNVTVFLGWVMHLKVPYYKAGEYHSGAACCQMILNYIRKGLADDLTQEEIYNYGYPFNYTENSNLLEMDPKAVEYSLGHFDPYDFDDPNGKGDMRRGYNFAIGVFESDKFTNYLRDIIHWMAFPVTVGYWKNGGELVAWPNTPCAAPTYGTYNHWVVVNGASATENPTPEPLTNPRYTPDFTVYGLWLTDPALNGIGQDLYVTSQTAQEKYLLPLSTSDQHNKKYLHVSEPPEIQSEANVEIAEPEVNEETRKIVEIAREIIKDIKDIQDNLSIFEKRFEGVKKHIYDAALVVNLENDAKSDNNAPLPEDDNELLNSVFDVNSQAAIELDWKKIIDSSILTDENFRKVFNGSQVRDFIKVRRVDKEDSYYYLIPFDKYIKGQFLTYAAIIIDSENGSFEEASWVDKPTRFIQVSKEKAVELILLKYPYLENTEFVAELIWKPGDITQSPFYPYYRVISGNEIYFVTQNGEVIKENEN